MQLLNVVRNQYSNILEKAIGADELISLIHYELCKTDLAKKDLEKLHFFSEYLRVTGLNPPEEFAYSLTSIKGACQLVLSMKEDKEFRETILSCRITNKQEYELFNGNNSAFSELVVRATKRPQRHLDELMNSQLNQQALLKNIKKMKPSESANFKRNIKQIQTDIEKANEQSKLEEQLREKNRPVIQAIIEYRDFLKAKIKEESINRDDPNLSSAQRGLVNRERALQTFLNNYEYFLLRQGLIEAAKAAYDTCFENEPDSAEILFLQKLSDVPVFSQYMEQVDAQVDAREENNPEPLEVDIKEANKQPELDPKILEKNRRLIEIIEDYSGFLQAKIEKEGINRDDQDLSPIQEKLVNRAEALEAFLRVSEESANTKPLIADATSAFKTCLANQPDWSERPFLQKLTDVLSLGIKPIYRTFFSQEAKHLAKLSDEVVAQSPKMGG
nr:hypothetical protein [Legionella massiliensis]